MDERRRAEAHVHLMQDELIQSNKLATLGQIAAGVAHEINQPVAAIRAYADNATVFLDRADQKTAKANLGLISGLTERIGLITDELRAFARKSSAPPRRSPCARPSMAPCCWSVPRLRQQGVRVIRDEADEAARVMAERFRLEQVLVNLLQNAIEALEGRTDPEIRRPGLGQALASADPGRRQRSGCHGRRGQDPVHAVRDHQAARSWSRLGDQPRHRRRVRRRAFPGACARRARFVMSLPKARS
jgi:phosphoglycerate-specific signal transduction histidine kinase